MIVNFSMYWHDETRGNVRVRGNLGNLYSVANSLGMHDKGFQSQCVLLCKEEQQKSCRLEGLMDHYGLASIGA